MKSARVQRFVRTHWFGSGLVGFVTNPFYIARSALSKAVREVAPRVRGAVLDVGCGLKPYQTFFAARTYIGLELGTGSIGAKNADVVYDGRVFPFCDESFDTAIANQVFEHVFAPAELLRQLHRVLRPGGGLLMTVPFVWDEHEQPIDYGRYTSFGLTHVLQCNGFEVVQLRKSGLGACVIFQLMNCCVYKGIHGWNPLIRFPLWLLITPMVNLLGLVAALLPANEDLYLDNVVFATKVSHDA